MSKPPQSNLAAAVVAVGIVVVVLAVANPAMLGLVVPVALVLLGIYAKKKQEQQAVGRAPTAAQSLQQAQQRQTQQPQAPQGQQAQQPPPAWAQPGHPVSHQAPPPQWWATQTFPQSQPPVPAPPPSPPPTPVDPENITVSPDLHARVEVLRKTGKTVEAIDLLREETGMELYPASRYVLAIEVP